jgi:phospholipid-binding lipoprotein MlaA
MKISSTLSLIVVVAALCVFSGCASQTKGNSRLPEPEIADKPVQSSAAASSEADSAPALTAEEEGLLKDDWDTANDQGPRDIYKVADPIEPFNRVMFQFNDKLYEWLLRPLSLGYRKVTPQKVRTGVQNFFVNLTAPARTVSCILQGKGRAATTEIGKFMINSTFGILGFMDLFTDYPELYPDAEDLGQSLAVYGIGDGFYLVLPFFGSSTLRDAVGQVGDTFMDPVTYIDPLETAVAVKGLNTVNRLSFRIEDIDDAKKAAFDPYEAARNFYTQSRQNRIRK